MPIDLKKALKTDDPKWDKLKQGYKKVETGAWNALAPVGNWTNRTAGKFGAESQIVPCRPVPHGRTIGGHRIVSAAFAEQGAHGRFALTQAIQGMGKAARGTGDKRG